MQTMTICFSVAHVKTGYTMYAHNYQNMNLQDTSAISLEDLHAKFAYSRMTKQRHA